MQKIPMTVEGEAALRIELEKLKKEDRPTVIQAIAEAREHGDLKENAEYHAAREQQGFIEGRIQDIESKLSLCQIVDISQIPQGDRVIFGSTVTIINTDTDEELKYRIVGDDEADVKAGMISYQSPIARALISKEIGDVVNVHTPGGEVEYEIDDVSYSG
ncbi:transcription elongation factor GreA [Porticoccaceae bacterium]|jgi:transcription elongation factor GreA|nr:transcription elongation factor GreA [Porticoccaceae bacterium]